MNNQILEHEIESIQDMIKRPELKWIERYSLSTYLTDRLKELSRRNLEW